MKNQWLIFLLTGFLTTSCIDEPMPKACFTYEHHMVFGDGPIGMTDSVQFNNCSTDAESYLWDFGDGQFSNETSPMHVFSQDMPAIVSLTAMNGSNTNVLTDTIWEWAIVYKPNIYLYPTETMNLCVSINFPKGGKVIHSIPDYSLGWCVNIEPSGKINNSYDYLFYESVQPNIWQHEKGWCIAKDNLEPFFTNNMQERGFAPNEINDFISYWIPILKTSPFYKIYPQEKSNIEQLINLDFSKQPQVFYRLYYVIEPVEESVSITEPKSTRFEREGFTAVEWGVVLN